MWNRKHAKIVSPVRIIRYENGRVVEVFEGSPNSYKRFRQQQKEATKRLALKTKE